jgi:5-methylcytosine-specific restriction protein A
MQPVTSNEQIVENLRVLDAYRADPTPEVRRFFSDRLRLGNKFVVARIGDDYAFAPSRFAGYASCTMERHKYFAGKDGRVTNRALIRLLGRPLADETFEAAYVALCHAVGVEPANRHGRAFWYVDSSDSPEPAVRYASREFPAEMREFVEGATKRVIVNAYERDPDARNACLAHYGCSCAVCGFEFKERYGPLGAGFIHVHHLTPISKRKVAHAIDPILELRPVCPNCHAMLHRSDPPLTMDELRSLLRT